MKALRLFAGQKSQSFLLYAAFLFFCVSALTFPLFADEREDLTAAMRKAIQGHRTDEIDIAEITRLLEAGADPNGLYNTQAKDTFLMHAADTNNVALARLLLDHGADPNAVTNSMRLSAVFYGDKEITALFISYGARFDVMNKDGYSPLRHQAYEGNISTAILLLEWEQAYSPDFPANYQTRKDYLADVISIAMYGMGKNASEENYIILTERLLNAGADILTPNNYALWNVIKKNKLELASLLLKSGADPNKRYENEWDETVLMKADSKEAINLLVKYGADPNIKNMFGETALHSYLLSIEKVHRYPLTEKDISIITALLEAGTRPADKTKGGDSALATAFRISIKREDTAFLRDIVQKYANEEENKIASADAERTVTEEENKRRREWQRDKISNNTMPTVWAISLPVILGGLSYYMREVAYKDNPSDNFMLGVNSGLVFGGAGFFLGAMIGGGGGLDGLASGLLGGILGGIAGFAIGAQSSVYNAFSGPVFYYAPAVILGLIAVYKIIWD